MGERVVIIDGNSLINRAYYAMQRPMITREGIYTQGIYGFLNMLTKIREDYKPEYLTVAFDLKAPTFRHLEYKEYKAGRKPMPPELAMEIPLLKEILQAMNIPILELEGFEADDIIGTFAAFCDQNPNCQATIISSDHDLLQLITPSVHMKMLKAKDFVRYTKTSFMDEYGIEPIKIIECRIGILKF